MKKFLMVLAGPGGAAVACRSNCKNIATAIAMDADDFRLPPPDLGRLTRTEPELNQALKK